MESKLRNQSRGNHSYPKYVMKKQHKKHNFFCKGSCFSDFFGGECSGTPPECQDCKDAIQCERNSSISTSGAVVSKHAGGYGYEYVEYNQPPSVNYKCPIGLFGKGDRSWLTILPHRPRHTERRLHPREPLFHWRRAMHGKRHM